MKKILITTLMATLMTVTICADETNIPPKPEGIEEMPPSVNMTRTPVQIEEYFTDEELLELGIWKEDNTVIIEDSNK